MLVLFVNSQLWYVVGCQSSVVTLPKPPGDHLMQGLYYIHNALRKDLYALEKLFLNTNSMTSEYAKDVLDW